MTVSELDDLSYHHQKRLTIAKLVLINFKSYAGRQEIGPFHKSFSAIVGPNGSGKSNVIDALLFVFGFRAKKMRQGKLSELIHHSKDFPDLESCSVEIHFEDVVDVHESSSVQSIPNSSLIVSRVAFKSNKSQYYINDKASSFTEVTDLLKGRGIDLDHKRFLILQGEVESIALMKPKAANDSEDGLLEYLEDIIGTSEYKKNIEDLEKKVESFIEEKDERLNRLKIVEQEKTALTEKRQEAEDYLRRENEVIRLQSIQYQVGKAQALRNFHALETKASELGEKLKMERESFSSQAEEIKSLEDSYNSGVKEYETLKKRTEEISKELAKFDREDIQMQERRKFLKNKIKKISKNLSTGKSELSAKAEAIKAMESDLQKCENEMKNLQGNLETEETQLGEIIESLKGKTDVFQVELEKKQKELAPWTEKINDQLSRIKVFTSEREILDEKIHATEKSMTQIKSEMKQTLDGIQAKKDASVTIEAELGQIKGLLEEAKAHINSYNEKELKVKQEFATLRQQVEDSRKAVQEFRSSGNVLASLLREKQSKRIKGIHGRLGDLGTIEAKYDVAISTACGRLDNIVVDNTSVAQACIEFLKRNNLGRATFIALDKMKDTKSMTGAKLPTSVHRLFDLVQIKDELYKKAFYFALGDTLVCDNLDVANKLAFGQVRHRVVTLDGKLIDTSGTMSGGGSKVSKGGMKSSSLSVSSDDVKPEDIPKLEKLRDEKSAELNQIQSERSNLTSQVKDLQGLIKDREFQKKKADMELGSAKAQLDDLKKREAELKSQNVKPDQSDVKRIADLAKEISKAETEIEKLRKSSSNVEDEIKKLQEQIMQVGGIKLKAQKSKVDGLREQIETLRSRVSKLKVEIGATSKTLQKNSGNSEKQVDELQGLEESLKALESEMNQKVTVAMDVKKRCEEAQAAAEDEKERLDTMKRNLEERSQVMSKFRAMEVEYESKLEDYAKNMKDLHSRATSFERKQDSLKLQKLEFESEEEQMLPMLEEKQLLAFSDKDISRLERELANLQDGLAKSKPNLSVLNEYKRKAADYLKLAQDMDDFQARYDEIKLNLEDVKKKRYSEFMAGFTVISQKLKEMYQMITMGGNAELELVDSLDPFSEGIIFSVMPPKKSWKNISNLSGGEKTLSSLALVFALHHFKPTPLYFMDEIDAALDFRNVSIVANYIKERTKNSAQFIIISLRNNMFELADRLIGIYKTYQCTKSIAIDPALVAAVTQPIPTTADT